MRTFLKLFFGFISVAITALNELLAVFVMHYPMYLTKKQIRFTYLESAFVFIWLLKLLLDLIGSLFQELHS